MFRRKEDLSEELGKIGAELERQAAIYQGLGVQKDAVMRLLAPRPDQLPKELTIPVVTLGMSVDPDRQTKFAGIELDVLDEDTPASHYHDIGGGITYNQPQLIWMQDGSAKRYRGDYAEHLWSHLRKYERPATITDGIALYLVHPNIREVLQDHQIMLPGSIHYDLGLDNGKVPIIGWAPREQTGAMYSWFTRHRESMWGAATCGGWKPK